MGFICPVCNRDFGNNRDWFNDHMKTHDSDSYIIPKPITIVKEQNVANLKSIQNAIKSDKIRVWMNFDGKICFQNTKTGNECSFNPYYDMNGDVIEYE